MIYISNMPCLICKDSMHETRECTSNHARTIEAFVSNWIMNILTHLYSTNRYIPDIHWISQSYHMIDLTKGDLLYLNRNTMMDDPMFINQKLIYIYLHSAVWSFYQMRETTLSETIKKSIRADISYWYRLANSLYTVEVANVMRQIDLSPPYQYFKKENTNDEMDCPVCLDNKIEKKNTHQYNCSHSVCLKCSDELLSRVHLKCPLCRTDIQTIFEFTL